MKTDATLEIVGWLESEVAAYAVSEMEKSKVEEYYDNLIFPLSNPQPSHDGFAYAVVRIAVEKSK